MSGLDESSPAGSPASTLLDTALEQLRLEGAIFFRSELTDAFELESTPGAVANVLYPGAKRLILFHIVAEGSCWVAVDGAERRWADAGDVIVLPYGDRHTLGGTTPTERVSILSLLAPPPWEELPVVRHGGGGVRTDLVCGWLYSDDPLFDPAIAAFPPAFVVRPPASASGWVQASVAYSLETKTQHDADRSPVSVRLPELVLVEMLRLHLASSPGADRGWIAALRDPVLAPALALLHGAPERPWTVTELASNVAVSRSLLNDRFRDLLGRAPMQYLTEWRMHLAEGLLRTTDLGVATIARRVGYQSEEAFSRAFKRTHQVSPSHWRAHGAPT